VELHIDSPNTPSWCGVQLKHRDKFTFTVNGLDDRGSIPERGREFFSLRHRVQTGSGSHSTSCPMEIRDSFLGSKPARAWS